ncbi:hypothetical protein FMN63_02860 [Stappia sp. BW2]|uniref:hypothetical protein n=1 Tax=Stappia sp. BW2 TaxID=2592622 RepID=UPI0011DE5EE8|nr:hypothetical protein [Stappia sp. BW2]TYC78820.1 hypothetical protein FMN63_02860 [Stappia sp. BW2]
MATSTEHITEELERIIESLPDNNDATETGPSGNPFVDYARENFEAVTGSEFDGLNRLSAQYLTYNIWTSYNILKAAGGVGSDSASQEMNALRHKAGYHNAIVNVMSSMGRHGSTLGAINDDDDEAYNIAIAKMAFDSLRMTFRIVYLLNDKFNEKYVKEIKAWYLDDKNNPKHIFGENSNEAKEFSEIKNKLTTQVDSYSTLIQEHREYLQEHKSHLESKSNILASQINDINTERDSINNLLPVIADQKAQLGTEIGALKKTIEKAESSNPDDPGVTTMQSKLAWLEQQLTDLETEKTGLEEQYKVLTNQMHDLDNQKIDIATTMPTLEAELKNSDTPYYNNHKMSGNIADLGLDGLGIVTGALGLALVSNTADSTDLQKTSANLAMSSFAIEGLTTIGAVTAELGGSKMPTIMNKGFRAIASSLGTAAMGVEIASVAQQLDNPDLTDYQKNMLRAELGIQAVAMVSETLTGVFLASGAYFGAASTAAKTASKAVPVLGAVTAIAGAFSPSTWSYFSDKQDQIDDLKAIEDSPSAALLAELMGAQLKTEIRHHAATKVIDTATALGATLVAGAGIGIGIALVGGAVSAIVQATQQVKFRQIAAGIEKKMRTGPDGHDQTIEEFFQQSFDAQQEETLAGFEDFFDELVDEGGYESIFTLGSQTLTDIDVQLAGQTYTSGELNKTATHYFEEYYGNQQWSDVGLEAKLQEGNDVVVLTDLSGAEAYLTFTSPLLASGVEDTDRESDGKNKHVTELHISDLAGWEIQDVGTNATTFNLSQVINRVKPLEEEVSIIDFVVHAGAGDDTYIAYDSEITFHGGEGRDTATYVRLDPTLLANIQGKDLEESGQKVARSFYPTPSTGLAGSLSAVSAVTSAVESGNSLDVKQALEQLYELAFSGESPDEQDAELALITAILLGLNPGDSLGIQVFASGDLTTVLKVMGKGSVYYQESTEFKHTSSGKDSEKLEVRFVDAIEREADEMLVDRLSSIEVIQGTQAADLFELSESTSVEEVHGFGGNDIINGGVSTRIAVGGQGDDKIDLSKGIKAFIAKDSFEQSDVVYINGGSGVDTVTVDQELTNTLAAAFSEKAISQTIARQMAASQSGGTDDGTVANMFADSMWITEDNPYVRMIQQDVEFVKFGLDEGALVLDPGTLRFRSIDSNVTELGDPTFANAYSAIFPGLISQDLMTDGEWDGQLVADWVAAADMKAIDFIEGQVSGMIDEGNLVKVTGAMYLLTGETVEFQVVQGDLGLVFVDGSLLAESAGSGPASAFSYTASTDGFVTVDFLMTGDSAAQGEYHAEIKMPGQSEFEPLESILPGRWASAMLTPTLKKIGSGEQQTEDTYHLRDYNDLTNSILFDQTTATYSTRNTTVTFFDGLPTFSDHYQWQNELPHTIADNWNGVVDRRSATDILDGVFEDPSSYAVFEGEIYLSSDNEYTFRNSGDVISSLIIKDLKISNDGYEVRADVDVFGVMPGAGSAQSGSFATTESGYYHYSYVVRADNTASTETPSRYGLEIRSGQDAEFEKFDPQTLAAAYLDGYANQQIGYDRSLTMIGDELGEFLKGGNGDDFIIGMAGNDTIWSGGGFDILMGADGDDIFWVGRHGTLQDTPTGHDAVIEVYAEDYKFNTFVFGHIFDGSAANLDDVNFVRNQDDLLIVNTNDHVTSEGFSVESSVTLVDYFKFATAETDTNQRVMNTAGDSKIFDRSTLLDAANAADDVLLDQIEGAILQNDEYLAFIDNVRQQSAEFDSIRDGSWIDEQIDQIEDTLATDYRTIGEVGTEKITDQSVRIDFDKEYDNPIVFTFVSGYDDASPVVARIANIDATGFEMFLQKPINEGGQSEETVSYLVVEEGTYTLPDGTVLHAMTQDVGKVAKEGFVSVDFGDVFKAEGATSALTPAVMSSVQTYNGTDFVKTRTKNVSEDGMKIALEEEESRENGGHTTETVGVLAIERGVGGWAVGGAETMLFEVSSLTSVTDDGKTGNFLASFDEQPIIFSSMSTYDGKDPASVRISSFDEDSFNMFIQEDTSAGDETKHSDETVDYFAFNSEGFLYGHDNDLPFS